MKKYRDIVGRHESFDMRLKKLVPGGGAALSYTAHFRCAALPTAALCGAVSCLMNKTASGQHVRLGCADRRGVQAGVHRGAGRQHEADRHPGRGQLAVRQGRRVLLCHGTLQLFHTSLLGLGL